MPSTSTNSQLSNLSHSTRVSLSISNERYLRAHPEIKHIMSYFTQRWLLEKPTDIFEFARTVFTDDDLKVKVESMANGQIAGNESQTH
ncbi:hypothetical protein BKA69DRAFT_1058070 [Paraphysoderma sedebokerense]|nr:hypothetical protein BKA69DRAFT_1058070 [Paraphysoderma sedebokerense]